MGYRAERNTSRSIEDSKKNLSKSKRRLLKRNWVRSKIVTNRGNIRNVDQPKPSAQGLGVCPLYDYFGDVTETPKTTRKKMKETSDKKEKGLKHEMN